VFTPRYYQTEGVQKATEAVVSGFRNLILVAPCAAGKTLIGAMLIQGALRKGIRCLFLAHRRELIRQSFEKLYEGGVPLDAIGIEMAGVDQWNRTAGSDEWIWAQAKRNPNAPIQLASVDTLRRRELPPAGLVIDDECHRCTSKTRREFAAHYANSIRIGLTATPIGPNGGSLADVYEKLIIVATPSELAAAGHVLTPRVFTVPKSGLPDLRGVPVSQATGDYRESELTRAVDRGAITGNAIDHWRQYADGLPTVLFPASIVHSQHCVAEFNRSGIPAIHLDGKMSAKKRAKILSMLKSGEVSVLSSCDCISEGFDFPPLACAIDVSPTLSLVRHMQRMGRVLRLWPGKERPIILDHAGNCVNHGRPDIDREWELRAICKGEKRPVGSPISVVCKQCFAVFPHGTRECECGYVFGTSDNPRIPEVVDGQLVEDAPVKADKRKIAWDGLVAKCKENGYKPGWAKIQFKQQFGFWPPFKFPVEEKVYTQEEKMQLWERLKAEEASGKQKPLWARIQYSMKVHEPAPHEGSIEMVEI
jgi:DNA repair protein RadD